MSNSLNDVMYYVTPDETDEILQYLQQCFGPKQQVAANLCHAVPAFTHFDDADGDWDKLEATYRMYSNRFSDPAIIFKSEYNMWHCKWQQQPVEHRPKSALAALDHS